MMKSEIIYHKNYIIFEDNCWNNFLPFTFTRFTGDIRAGVLKLRQRLGIYFDFEPKKIVIREDLSELYKKRHDDWEINNFPKGEYIFINSRLKVNEQIKNEIINLKFGQKLVFENDILAFSLKFDQDFSCSTENINGLHVSLEKVVSNSSGMYSQKNNDIINSSSPLWNFTWEFLLENGNLIKDDFQQIFYEEDNFMEIDPGVIALNPYDIWIGENTIIKHGVLLDASEGPVIIDENVTILHNTVIIGPVYIGKNSLIKIGAKIYGNTSIGPFCKVGGEVSGCIFQAYSNKQHDGYLGQSFIGEWVNIGADTNNSDLKNTYKPVKVWFYPQKKKISTDCLFIGVFIGDHSKIGINCSINTGAMIGFGVNLYGSDMISDFIPSFSWGEAKNLALYQIDKFLETASTVKKRRNEDLKIEEINLINKIYIENNEVLR
ncbi:MAG: hypothetical protein FWG98_07025 [Candidatus Cloacimonetes bacterium]|nr:hypothetical protein [Candidatus Cloacimonadota bacterium]